MSEIAIIGTGPSAISAYWAMENLNLKSLAVYSGYELNEKEPQKYLEISKKLPSLTKQKSGFENFKTQTHHFQIPENIRVTSKLSNSIGGSYSFGGWSQVWGATIDRWGIDYFKEKMNSDVDLTRFYEIIENRLPLIQSERNNTNLLIRNFEKLVIQNDFFRFEESKLSINPVGEFSKSNCVLCGLCLKGCPYGHIWNASTLWKEILTNPMVNNFNNFVTKVIKNNNKWKIISITKEGLETESIDYDKIFIAAGSISSSTILVNSGIMEKVTLSDSPITFVPFRLKKLKKTGLNENRITLSEVFGYSNYKNNLTDEVFMQLYGYSTEFKERLYTKFKFLKLLPSKIVDVIFSRLGMAMIFQDSKHGGKIGIEKNHTNTIVYVDKPRVTAGLANLRDELKNLKQNGLIFYWKLNFVGSVGEGYHFGSAFNDTKGGEKFDFNKGSFIDQENLFIVDSTSLPSIASRPITLTIMANSYRITSQALSKEKHN